MYLFARPAEIQCFMSPGRYGLLAYSRERLHSAPGSLIQEGRDPCARNASGRTPLDIALAMGQSQVVNYLHIFRIPEHY